MLDIYLPLTPTPKGRPRFSPKDCRVYTPASTIKSQNDIGILLKSHMSKNSLEMSKKPISLIISFYFEQKIGTNGRPENTRPDIDNLLKLTMDAMNGIVYQDDRQVIHVTCFKLYAKENGISIKVEELNSEGLHQQQADLIPFPR